MNPPKWLLAIGVFAVVPLLTAPLHAKNEGLAELDEATGLKLKAKSFDDLGKVVELCEKAIEKGLDDSNKAFALRLGGAALLQRATAYSRGALKIPRDPRWLQMRRLALADLERATKQSPDFSQAHLLTARLQLLPGGDRKKAIGGLDHAIRSADDDHLKAEALVLRAEHGSDMKKRTADFDKAVELAPRDARVIRSRGLFHFTRGQQDKAITDLKKATELDEKDLPSYEALGVAQMMAKKIDDALATFDQAIKLAPRAARLYTHRAQVHAVKGDLEKALADLGKSLELDPKNLQSLLIRARLYQSVQNFDQALEDINRALEIEPRLIVAREMRVGLLLAQKKFDQAARELELLSRGDPDNIERLLQLAAIYNAAENTEKAIEIFDKILAKDAGNWQALRGRGDTYLGLGKHAEAIADFEAGLKIKPDDSGILNNIAWVLATSTFKEVRNGKRAIEYGKRACQATDYKKPHILSTLAAGYAESGNFEEAVKWSKKAVETDDGAEQLKQLRAELKSYQQGKPWRENLAEKISGSSAESKRKTASKPPEPKNE